MYICGQENGVGDGLGTRLGFGYNVQTKLVGAWEQCYIVTFES